MTELERIATLAKEASVYLSTLDTEGKNNLLRAIADALRANADYITAENAKDLANARENGLSKAMQDRLLFDGARIDTSADGVLQVVSLPDPVGEVIETYTRPNGMTVEKRRVPMGVVGIIYEARPNVTVDTAVLCIKASNAVMLRGGKEAIHTNTAIVKVMKKALSDIGADENMIGFVEDTSRDSANAMMKLKGYIDVLIPRGGAGLINAVVMNSTVPVIETGVGNCHIYVDKSADIKKAVDIVVNAKTSRPSVCNAAESLLVHKDVDDSFYKLLDEEFKKKEVKVYGHGHIMNKLTCQREACDEDFATEFLDYAISAKTVASVDEAIEHIRKFSTGHSECIVTEDENASQLFTACIDAAAVYVNVSTRFTDGFEFGFGAEIGISTQKLHARGPMGLRELTSYKYVITGNGQIR
ncbi:MAG: glutamate-5-semialdehyde dehydrogenase [Clostridia bacterium]|nr:glutamate-5-semialdehyde dehydrogenase [Clostridia bacterium]